MVKKEPDKKNLKKNGFTLMELVVYMAIVGIVVLIAGQAFSDSTKFRVRSQNILKAQQIAGNLKAAISFDIYNTGAKSSKETQGTANKDDFYFDDLVYMDKDGGDLSSYALVYNLDGVENSDSLTIRRMRYTANGKYEAVEEIAWFVKENILKRSCKTIGGTEQADGLCPKEIPNVVDIAENVTRFNIIPGIPSEIGSSFNLLPSTDTSIHDFRLVPRFGSDDLSFVNTTPTSGTNIELKGFASNYNFSAQEPDFTSKKANQVYLAQPNNNAGDWKSLCSKVTLNPYTEYELSFSMPFSEDASRMFCPGRDHMAVGFRNDNGEKPANLNLEDFLFYPPTLAGASAGKRSFRFDVKDTVKDVCLAFTFASYSPIASSGSVFLSNIVLKRVETANYTFDETTALADDMKQNVKAFQMDITVNQKGEASNMLFIVPTPSNGPKD